MDATVCITLKLSIEHKFINVSRSSMGVVVVDFNIKCHH